MGEGLEYWQELIDLISLDEYPEISELVIQNFPLEEIKNLTRREYIQNNIYQILCALLTCHAVAQPRGTSYYAKRRKAVPDWYTQTYVVAAQDLLEQTGLVTILTGWRRAKKKKGVASVVSSTAVLDEILAHIDPKPYNVDYTDSGMITLNRTPVGEEEISELEYLVMVKEKGNKNLEVHTEEGVKRASDVFQYTLGKIFWEDLEVEREDKEDKVSSGDLTGSSINHDIGTFLDMNSIVTKEILLSAYKDMVVLNRDYFSQIDLGFLPDSTEEILKILSGKNGKFSKERLEKFRAALESTETLPIMPQNVHFTAMFSTYGEGRLFQRSSSYQSMPKELREHMSINGLPIVELDFEAMHINLAYVLSGVHSPYVVNGIDPYMPIVRNLGFGEEKDIRSIVKFGILVALNTHDDALWKKAMLWNHEDKVYALKDRLKAIGKVNERTDVIDEDPKKQWAKRRYHESMDALGYLMSSIQVTHPIIMCDRDPHLGKRLQFYEGQIIRKASLYLMNKGILSLPMHDGMIGQEKYEQEIRHAMRKTYEEVTNTRIAVNNN